MGIYSISQIFEDVDTRTPPLVLKHINVWGLKCFSDFKTIRETKCVIFVKKRLLVKACMPRKPEIRHIYSRGLMENRNTEYIIRIEMYYFCKLIIVKI